MGMAQSRRVKWHVERAGLKSALIKGLAVVKPELCQKGDYVRARWASFDPESWHCRSSDVYPHPPTVAFSAEFLQRADVGQPAVVEAEAVQRVGSLPAGCSQSQRCQIADWWRLKTHLRGMVPSKLSKMHNLRQSQVSNRGVSLWYCEVFIYLFIY